MAWDHLAINKPHLVYIILGGFTSLFMLCSSIIKERLYIGEATVATICGIIFGPHAANLINPGTWGNTDQITLEFSRIVLVVQCFAVGVELPKHYMEKHWRSVTFLLIPVMTFGWLVTSLFIWAVFHQWANWLDCLCLAACVTATDPVLASSVVGKGKFAKRVPKHLRDLLSAESGCNDGMAFPFIYLALYIIRYRHHPDEVALNWICVTILYECIFGAIYGVAVGYIARRLVRYAHERDYIDRESFLVFYFVLALFCAGSGSILGIDDLLVGFACGVGFSNDGWFTEKTEESHVSNVIDLLINLAFFVYFGTIIPWQQYNSGFLGLDVWRLVVIALLVLFFRRIPIMMALKPVIPDIKTWREALFAGHFGPIGVGAIFVAILARAELEDEHGEGTTPLAVLPGPGFPHRNIIELIWPITTFLVITSIVVHGSSIAVFTLGKHINTLTLTMSYSKAVDEPNWMDRLPRIQSRSKSSMSMQSDDDEKLPPGELPIGKPGTFLRRQKEEDNPSRAGSRSNSRHRSKRSKSSWDYGLGPGGPVSQSAIKPQRRQQSPEPAAEPYSRSDSETLAVKSESPPSGEEKKGELDSDSSRDRDASPAEIYEEGDETIYEDKEGNVLAVEPNHEHNRLVREESEREEGKRLMHEEGADRHHGIVPGGEHDQGGEAVMDKVRSAERELIGDAEGSPEMSPQQSPEQPTGAPQRPGKRWREGVNKVSTMRLPGRKQSTAPQQPPEEKPKEERKHGPARAYQFGNTIIVEDEDGEVIKKYDIPAPDRKQSTAGGLHATRHRIGNMGKMFGLGGKDGKVQAGAPGAEGEPSSSASPPAAPADKKDSVDADDDDHDLRFTISSGGRRMSKAEFIDEIRDMDPKKRVQAVEDSNAPEAVKREARKEAREQGGLMRRGTSSAIPVVAEETEYEDGMATLQQVTSHDSNELKLVTSKDQHIPFHDVSRELRNYQMRSPTGETAAERRRRQHAQRSPVDEEDSEDDGTERVPPQRHAGPAQSGSSRSTGEPGETAAERRRREGALGLRQEQPAQSRSEQHASETAAERRRRQEALGHSPEQPSRGRDRRPANETGETAAEKRRREGALGLRHDEESSSEDDDEPRQIPQPRQNIRFADQAPQEEKPARQSTLKWGKNIGR